MSTAQQAFDRFQPQTAWQAYFPNGANPWNDAKVAHLYRRAACGADWREIQAGVDSTPRALVSRLISGSGEPDRFEDEARRLEDGALATAEPRQLKAVWLYRLMYSPHPLRERLTLFWHNHFATSNAKVQNVHLMHRQNEVLRRHALGHFGDLLHEITRDPAMIVWLDSNVNKKGSPNENFAREVFELFSLGVGNYTEQDIKEAARAFTGWDVRDGRAVFNPAEFDRGEKTVLGQTGPWTAGDIVRIALGQPACSRFLVRKLFRELVSETVEPADEMLETLVDGFRLRNYDITWLVETMLRSWVFYSPAAIGQRVKGPVEFVAGSVRALDGRISPARLADVCDQLGQSLYYPPSVKGWDGGRVWLNSTTLLFRQNFAFELTRGTGPARHCDPARLVDDDEIPDGDEELVRFFLRLFLQRTDHDTAPEMVEYLHEERERQQRALYSPRAIQGLLARSAAHLVMALPEYQLS
ncbi:MAG TPA: DUF1800 domain-containing protein [Planctomycetaceae bacterium]|nr:DUF1800 domain-containing protein [Planctomycetaceae bacterium]